MAARSEGYAALPTSRRTHSSVFAAGRSICSNKITENNCRWRFVRAKNDSGIDYRNYFISGIIIVQSCTVLLAVYSMQNISGNLGRPRNKAVRG